MKTRLLMMVLISMFEMSYQNSFSQQNSGLLDTSFNHTGKFVGTVDSSTYTPLNKIVVQPDSKVLAAGLYVGYGGATEFYITRLKSNGERDSTFDYDGMLRFAIPQFPVTAHAMCLQTDGKIITAGTITDDFIWPTYVGSFILARFNTDGSLDGTFSGGSVQLNLGASEIARAVLVQPDGKIVASGMYDRFLNYKYDHALIRLLPDGVRDSSFGINGQVINDFTENDVFPSMALQPNGKIVVAGDVFDGLANRMALARYNQNGTLDSLFGFNGLLTATIDSNANEEAVGVLIQPDLKIVIAARGYYPGELADKLILIRFNSDGSLDPSFGNNGKILFSISNRKIDARTLTMQSDNKLLVAGSLVDSTLTEVFFLSRFLSNGDIDTSFGNVGWVSTSIGNENDFGTSVQVDPLKRIVVGGNSVDGTSLRMAICRYLSGLDVGIADVPGNDVEMYVYPNPLTSGVIHLKYELKAANTIHVSLVSMDGSFCARILDGNRNAGKQEEEILLPNEIPSGVYLLKLDTEKNSVAIKVTVIK